MPSLRTLLQSVQLDRRFNPRTYALFQALVEALMPEDTCEQCRRFRTYLGCQGCWPDDSACRLFVVKCTASEDISPEAIRKLRENAKVAKSRLAEALRSIQQKDTEK